MQLVFGLHVGGHDFRMPAQVGQESVACPSTFDFYCFEGESSQKVFQGASDSEGVALEWGDSGFCCCSGKGFDEDSFGEETAFASLGV